MNKKKLEFSKILTLIITAIFIGTWGVAWYCWYRTQTVPTELLNFINIPFSSIYGCYFLKSGVENYTKIKSNNNDI